MDPILEFNRKEVSRKIPKIKAGDTVKVHQKIKEGDKERVQIFEGVVIKIHGGYGQNGTFTVRKIASGVGVEKIFPFVMPSLSKIEVTRRGEVRRAKLYYLREKQQKEARLKEKLMSEKEKADISYDEDVEAEKKKAVEEEAKKAAEASKGEDKTDKTEAPKKEEKSTEKKNEKKAEAKSEKKADKK
ncbi:50S ribosomal protein L19 [Patescibacteria group bacterium]|nr:50S ribosomal protein L19 [Patescibacteria group bacterium]